jgi:hypothetical protein
MGELIREERYIFLLGATEHVLRVQELISSQVVTWPGKFRIQIAGSHRRDGKTVYGRTALETAGRAMEYLSSSVQKRESPVLRASYPQ